jgi:hypothetical protein
MKRSSFSNDSSQTRLARQPGFRSALTTEDVILGIRLLSGLPGLLRHPISLGQARAILRGRQERRQGDFLDLARRAVYRHAASPYRRLLSLAGCEYGDLERLVHQEGVEGALLSLYRHGVYLVIEEFKGLRPAVRGSATVWVDPMRLRNPLSAVHARVQTGGSRGQGTPVPIDLGFIRDRAVNARLVFEAWGDDGWRQAVWATPGGVALVRVLEYAAFGSPAVRWFTQIDAAAAGLHPRYRWSARLLRWGSVLAGISLPRPELVPLDDPLPIARWMAELVQAGATPHLHTFASSAVRLCQAAVAGGIDLRGARMTVASEPITAARLAVIRQANAEALPYFASIECGPIGYGCLEPEAADEVHLLDDFQAVIQPGAAGATSALPPLALFLASLRATAPFVLLNVSFGDQAVLGHRACGCPLERLGWMTQLRDVRSFEKLTAGGMTFLDVDVIRVLEEVLPARFGGGPTDYQLVEEELDDGRPSLRVFVHPTVGPLDDAAVADVFLASIGGGSGARRVMELHWRQANLVSVERRPPLSTASGKILHLHRARQPSVV